MIIKLKAGDSEARDTLIHGHMRLAIKLACLFNRGNSCDVLGEALASLVKWTEAAKTELKDSNIGAYLHAHIKYDLRAWVRKNPLVHSKSSTKRDTVRLIFEDTANDLKSRDPDYVDLLDSIQAACRTTMEKQVVRLKFNGMDNKEVAKTLGVTDTHVRRILQTVKGRL